MEQLAVQEIADKILALVQGSQNHQITGVRLGVEIRNSFPGFSPQVFRCKNLRQFIETFVPAVKQVGPSVGPEVRYGLATEEASPPTRWKIATPAWRTFCNPHPKYALYANPATSDLATFPHTVSPGAPWSKVESCSESEHLRIAKEFLVTSVSEDSRSIVEKSFNDPKWWLMFALELGRLNLSAQWISFRHRELWKLLLTQLDAIHLEEPLPPLPPPVTQHSNASAQRVAAGPPVAYAVGPDDILREVVLAVVSKMALEDLRGLRLPVGDVLQAVKTHQ